MGRVGELSIDISKLCS